MLQMRMGVKDKFVDFVRAKVIENIMEKSDKIIYF